MHKKGIRCKSETVSATVSADEMSKTTDNVSGRTQSKLKHESGDLS